jgi:hypothetical protein
MDVPCASNLEVTDMISHNVILCENIKGKLYQGHQQNGIYIRKLSDAIKRNCYSNNSLGDQDIMTNE